MAGRSDESAGPPSPLPPGGSRRDPLLSVHNVFRSERRRFLHGYSLDECGIDTSGESALLMVGRFSPTFDPPVTRPNCSRHAPRECHKSLKTARTTASNPEECHLPRSSAPCMPDASGNVEWVRTWGFPAQKASFGADRTVKTYDHTPGSIESRAWQSRGLRGPSRRRPRPRPPRGPESVGALREAPRREGLRVQPDGLDGAPSPAPHRAR